MRSGGVENETVKPRLSSTAEQLDAINANYNLVYIDSQGSHMFSPLYELSSNLAENVTLYSPPSRNQVCQVWRLYA
jgi:hypothetical protein